MKIFNNLYFLIFLFFLSLLILSSIFPLSGDEAYYWDCSRNLDWSYFDQPPLVIWLTGIFGKIFHSNLFVRLPSILFSLLTFLLILKWKGKEGVWVFLILSLSPLLFFGSFYLSTDKALSFFYLLDIYIILKILEKNSNLNWLLLGLSTGLGALSKFPIILIAPIIFYALIKRANLSQFFIFLFTIILVASPLFIYAVQNDFSNILFQIHGRHKEKSNFLKVFTNLILSNILLIGPLKFIKGIYNSFKNYSREKILFLSGLIPIIFFLILGLKNPGAPHWIALGFYPLGLLQYPNWRKKEIKISIFYDFFLIFFIFLIFLFPWLLPFMGKHLVNYKSLKEEILKEKEREEIIITYSYNLLASLNYHLKEEEKGFLFNINRGVHGLSYLYWQKEMKFPEGNYLLISSKKLHKKSLMVYFKGVKIKEIKIKYKKLKRKFYFYHCYGLKDKSPFYPLS